MKLYSMNVMVGDEWETYVDYDILFAASDDLLDSLKEMSKSERRIAEKNLGLKVLKANAIATGREEEYEEDVEHFDFKGSKLSIKEVAETEDILLYGKPPNMIKMHRMISLS